MQSYNPRPSQRLAPSPGPGWTTLDEPESDEEENEEEDMLDRTSVPPGPAPRGPHPGPRQNHRGGSTSASSSSTRGKPGPPAFGRAFTANLPPPGPLFTKPPPPGDLWLADTFNSIGGSQPAGGRPSIPAGRPRFPGELSPWKSRPGGKGGKDGISMPPPALSASQLARADSSTSLSSSKVASAPIVPPVSNTPGRSFPLSAKPYADKQTARKTTGTHRTMMPPASQASVRTGTLGDKGKGKEKALPSIFDLASSRASGTSSVLPPSTAPPRFASGSSSGASASTARPTNVASENNVSEDEEFPDAAQFSAKSQAMRMAGKPSESRPLPPSKSQLFSKDRGDGPRKSLPSSSISSFSRPPPSTQPAPRKSGLNDRLESVSAPPASQPSILSRKNLATTTLIDLSSSGDEAIERRRLQQWKEEATRNGKGKQPRARQSGTPLMIDLTLEDSPPPRRQTARKSTGSALSPPRKAPSSSQRDKGKGNVVVEEIIDLTHDDPAPASPRQTARKSTGQRQQAQSTPPPPPPPNRIPGTVKGPGVQPPRSPRKPVEVAPVISPQTAHKPPGPDASQSTDPPNFSSANPRSPRQTARKSTGQVQTTLSPKPISHQTARKSTGQKPPIHNHQLVIDQSRERELPGISSGILRLAENDERVHENRLKLLSFPNDSLAINRISVTTLQPEDDIGSARISQPLGFMDRDVMNPQPATPPTPITSPEHFDTDVQMADSESMDIDMEVDAILPDDDAIPQIEFAVSEVSLDDNPVNEPPPMVLTNIDVTGIQVDEHVASGVGNEVNEADQGKPSDRIQGDVTPTDDEDVEVDAILSSSRSPSEHPHFPVDINSETTHPGENVEGGSSIPPTSDISGTPPILTTQMAKLDLSSAAGSQTPQRTGHQDLQSTLGEQSLDLLSRGVLASSVAQELSTLLGGSVQGSEANNERETAVSSTSATSLGSQPPVVVQSLAIPPSSQVAENSPSALPSNDVPSVIKHSAPPSITSSVDSLNSQVPPLAQESIKPTAPSIQNDHTLLHLSPASLRQNLPVQVPPTLSLRSTPASSSKEHTPLRPGSSTASFPGSSSSGIQSSPRTFPLDIEPVRKLKLRGTHLATDSLRKVVLNPQNSPLRLEIAKKSSDLSSRGLAETLVLRPSTPGDDGRPEVSNTTKGKEPMIGEKHTLTSPALSYSPGSLSTIRKMLSESSKQGRDRGREQSRRTSIDVSNHTTRTASPVTPSESDTTPYFATRPPGADRPILANVSTSMLTSDHDSNVREQQTEIVVGESMPDIATVVASPQKRPYPPSESEHEVGGNGFVGSATKQKSNKRLRRRTRPRSSSPSHSVPPPAQSHSRSSSTDTFDDLNLLANNDDQDALAELNVDYNPPEAFPEAVESIGREFASRYCQAKDLPHKLADVLNAMPKWEWTVYADTIRQTFESAMMSSTTFDEPDAPCIKVINEVDDDIIPPSEFCYTNLMWHGDNIPPPDITKLKGCDCVGKCDPKSRKCSCLQRAKITCDQAGIKKGFLYDMKGRLRTQEYPIYECNELCGCTEDCWNRVVQKGRKCSVNIVKTETKGWGIFAGRRIPSGTFVGIYSGEIITDEEGERRGLIYNKVGRTYLFDIDFWHISELSNDDDVNYTIDAFHAGNFTRFLNHSCDPNCKINAVYINETNIFKPLLAIFTTRDVDAGEELCFSYYGDADDETADDPNKNATAQEKKGDVWRKCECGARRCRGFIFSL